MDVGRAFKFVFDDPRWITKLLIGGVIALVAGLIPILGWVVGLVLTGYSLVLIRRVMDGYDTPLPEWEELVGLATLGVKALVVQLGWVLVATVLGFLLLVPGYATDSAGLIALGWLVLFVLGLAALALVPAALGRLAATGSIAAGLDFRAVFAMVRGNIGDYLILAVVAIVAGLIATAGFLLFVVGALLTVPYAVLVIAHLTGQAYFRSVSTLPPVAAGERPVLEP